MVMVLFIGAIFIVGFAIFAPLIGIISFTWIGLIISIIFAVLFVALANILSNQAEILDKLDRQDNRQKLLPTEKKICEKCNHSYDIDYKSCPKCGNVM